MDCSTHVWASERGGVSVGCGPLNGLVSLGRAARILLKASQITSPLNGPVNFLNSLDPDVCELASSVGRGLSPEEPTQGYAGWRRGKA